MVRFLDIGVDLGTSVVKATALDDSGRAVAAAERASVWLRPRPDRTELDPVALLHTVDGLLAETVARAGARARGRASGDTGAATQVSVRSVGFTSIAETGALLDPDGDVGAPMIAWHDPRGRGPAGRLPADIAHAFPARTGLPVSAVATLFKLAWLREHGIGLTDRQWLCVPEFVAHRLGAGRFSERSMLGRTGLLDIHTGGLWGPSLDLLGVGPDLLPPIVAAGALLGRVRGDHPVPELRYAAITVAGHDHLVAAAATGAAHPGTLLCSLGTAEALVAAVPAAPPPEATARLVAQGLAVYPHVVADTTCVLGALRSGMVLLEAARALGALSVGDRLALDREALATGAEPADVRITGLGMRERAVTVRAPTGASRESAWLGAIAATGAASAAQVTAMRAAGLTIDDVVVSGGWSHLDGVARNRRTHARRSRVDRLAQPGTVGAARFARWAATRHTEGTDPTTHEAAPADWFDGLGDVG